MFVDEVVMIVEAGTGGNGCMAYRREACVPMGGPFGGSGGKGSDIIFKADSGLKTLIDLKFQKKIKGPNGENGEGKAMNGKASENVIVKVPIGTTVMDEETGKFLPKIKLSENSEKITNPGNKTIYRIYNQYQ